MPPSGAGAVPPPGYPPPQPPPGFGSFPPPPPGTGGWAATRFGLVRPVQGRVFAGVCAAFARATNTDPVLWRVLLAVFTLFGGVGLLAYVLGWLLIPAEGDTGSPAEALVGRGHSNTSPFVVIVIGVIAVGALGTATLHGFRSGILPMVAIMAAIVLIT